MFVPLLEPAGPSAGPPLVVGVRGAAVVLRESDPPADALFLGTLDGRHCWAVDLDGDGDIDDDDLALARDLRRLWGAVDEVTWTVAGRAVQLVEWLRTHRFCGRCATPTEPADGERARCCPSCGLLAYPRLSPAVIMLVTRDDGRALLARGRSFAVPMYSCLAGFVEPGETLEQAVEREVREEVGLEVDDVAYWGSQPWPFPHSLMIGFTARYRGGDLRLDESEIADAGWFAPDDLPMTPPAISIARHMIDDWVRRSSA